MLLRASCTAQVLHHHDMLPPIQGTRIRSTAIVATVKSVHSERLVWRPLVCQHMLQY